jgi:repressor of nif and glnA expression
MIGQENREVERKIAAILKVLSDSEKPIGGRTISRRLQEQGINLGERAVRYHLKIMDERGFTKCTDHRDGRTITGPGLEELRSSLVLDKISFLTSKIELLSYLTTFNTDTGKGDVPVDISIFRKKDFSKALTVMEKVFKAGIATSTLVGLVQGGERLGDSVIPRDEIGFATICNVVVSGVLLKSGIPLDSIFGGLLELRENEPIRFVDLIEYDGSTIDPSEIFMASEMTSVLEAATRGNGKILASYHEIPVLSKAETEIISDKLKKSDLYNKVITGKVNENICEIPVRSSKIGLVLYGGLNPVAAVEEAGIKAICKSMGGVINSQKLRSFWSL